MKPGDTWGVILSEYYFVFNNKGLVLFLGFSLFESVDVQSEQVDFAPLARCA